MDETVYPESCTASRAMAAASDSGFFEEYFFTHFSRYERLREGYEAKEALATMEISADKFRISPEKKKKFEELFKSNTTPAVVYENIELAEKLNIESTPTILIAGRKITGVPPRAREFIENIIKMELSKNGN
jgi:protein-disulfide isomerase